ncbi:hypothetical protein FRC18_007892 [Serendipita sp. 400]|nr:hypothetical protein FRC18_007892 [Serendipita sp. 400]
MTPYRQNMGEVRIVSTSQDRKKVELHARVDDEWLVMVVPDGGYILGLIIQACNLVQASTSQSEPLYLSAQFLGASSVGPCAIQVNRIKTGRSYCNLTATLGQKGQVNLHVQLIYGRLEIAKHPFGPFPASTNHLTFAHPSGLSRRCPISIHPSKCTTTPFDRPFTFKRRLVQAVDPYYLAKMEELVGDVHTGDVDLGGSGFVWGAWYEMIDEDEVLSYSLVSFLADVSPALLPISLASRRDTFFWMPTLAMSIDFKHHIPTPSELANLPGIAPRTIGVLYTSKYLIDGRHDSTAEIWTAPSPIGRGGDTLDENWRDRMFCIAVATQTASSVPGSMNLKHEKKGQISPKL